MIDITEPLRRDLQREINTMAAGQPKETERQRLEALHGVGNVWDTKELAAEFKIIGFGAPFLVVRRLRDGALGSVMFQHDPRLYFGFESDK